MIAIDFETAHSFESIFLGECQPACSIALVQVEELTDPVPLFNSLIRPEPFYMDPSAEAIHGISLEDLADAPDFKTLWEKTPLGEILRSTDLLIAHNMKFDGTVLCDALNFYGIQIPDIQTADTLLMVRGTGWLKKHNLAECARYIGFPLDHHQAASDALACAALFQVMMLEDIPLSGMKPLSSFQNEH